MVAVQNLLGTLQVQVVFGVLVPRQIDQRLQISQLYVEVGRIGIHLVQLLQLLVEELLDILGPLLFAGLLQQVLLFGRTFVAHLSLQVLNLLLQEVVALLLVDIVACLVADVELQVLQIDLAVDDAHCVEQTLLDGVHHQQLHFLLCREGHVRADEVQRHDVVVHILQGERCLVGNILHQIDVLRHRLAQVVHSSPKLYVMLVGFLLGSFTDVPLQIGVIFDDVLQLNTSQALHNGSDVTIGQRQCFQHFADDTIVIEVGTDRHFHIWVTLGEDTDEHVVFLGLANERHAGLTANEDWRYYSRKQHQITHGQNGQRIGNFHFRQVVEVAFNISNH